MKLDRRFRAWARRTYRWGAGDFARLEREQPQVLAEIVAYWRARYGQGGTK